MKSTHELRDGKEPSTLEEAETQAFALWEEIQSIQLQLADPNRIGENKQRLPISEYLTWQHRAKYALTMKIRTYRYLKQWIKDQRAILKEQTASAPLNSETLHVCIQRLLVTDIEVLIKLHGTQEQQLAYTNLWLEFTNTQGYK